MKTNAVRGPAMCGRRDSKCRRFLRSFLIFDTNCIYSPHIIHEKIICSNISEQYNYFDCTPTVGAPYRSGIYFVQV